MINEKGLPSSLTEPIFCVKPTEKSTSSSKVNSTPLSAIILVPLGKTGKCSKLGFGSLCVEVLLFSTSIVKVAVNDEG